MKHLTATFLVLAITALTTPAAANLRCGHDLVQVGDSVAHLVLTCGEPMLRQTIALENTSTTEGIVEQWTYDFGPGTFLTIVTLEGGKVSVIEEGERR